MPSGTRPSASRYEENCLGGPSTEQRRGGGSDVPHPDLQPQGCGRLAIRRIGWQPTNPGDNSKSWQTAQTQTTCRIAESQWHPVTSLVRQCAPYSPVLRQARGGDWRRS